jgi:hypothetical protein
MGNVYPSPNGICLMCTLHHMLSVRQSRRVRWANKECVTKLKRADIFTHDTLREKSTLRTLMDLQRDGSLQPRIDESY